MDVQSRRGILNNWFELYSEFMSSFEVACAKACATCCTCNVTCTTLEGGLIYEYLVASGEGEALADRLSSVSANRFQPAVTTNALAALLVNGETVPEEVNDPEAGACQWLEKGICTIYEVRPFGCRAMCSSQDCATTGEAVMPPLVLSVNNLMMQYIEALDRPGGTGNLTDVLHYIFREQASPGSRLSDVAQLSPPLLSNRSFPVLMLPPEHRRELEPLLKAIGRVVRGAQ